MRRTDEDVDLYKATFDRNGSPRSLEHLQWQFIRNPTGRLNVEFAQAEGSEKLAAIYATMPVDLRVEGEVLPACQSLDTLTDVDFRGQGLFVKMAQAVFGRAETNGDACVYGFPNGNSAHGFFERLGWTRLDPVPFMVLPLRLNYFLRRLPRVGRAFSRLPGVPLAVVHAPKLPFHREFRPILQFGPDADDIWTQFAAGIPVAVHRDQRYLNWRLVEKPRERYQRVGLFENGQLRGFVAWCTKEKHGGHIGYVLELLHAPSAPDVARSLLQFAVSEMRRSGAEVVLAWNLEHSPNHSAFRSTGFRKLPERLRPIELHVGVRPLRAPATANIGNRLNWYLSYLDSDTV
ncbi:MAG: GNAT family N-acetyltransferase [Myxococcaceae bacterium]|nr:GNAT family N-acetyltransferase [Myxococcaceae bacterium]